MTSVNRALRIGIVIDGSIFEDRLLRRRSHVTIGQSTRNVFSIPVDELPMAVTLFTVRQGKYFLDVSDGMRGRVFMDGSLHELSQLSNNTERSSIPLQDDSRGRVVLGPVTVLFQFVVAPPVQPRPQLPPELRRSLVDRIDPALAAVLAVSLAAHLAIIIVAKQYDPPQSRYERVYEVALDTSADALLGLELTPTPTRSPEIAPGASAAVESKAPELAKPSTHRRATRTAAATREVSPETMRETVTRRVNQLFSADDIASGKRGGMGAKRPGQDIGKVAEEIKRRGDRVELSNGDTRGPKNAQRRRIGTVKRPGIDAPGPTTKTTSKEKVPRSEVLVKRPPHSPSKTTLTPAMVRKKIVNVYMAQLQRCHVRVLGKSPNAGGRVTIGFTVTASGRATGAWAKGFDSRVDGCIRARANHWRFPKPREDGEAVSQDFALTLQLRPR